MLLPAKNIYQQGHLVVPINKKVIGKRQNSNKRRLNILIEDMYMFFIPKNSVCFQVLPTYIFIFIINIKKVCPGSLTVD